MFQVVIPHLCLLVILLRLLCKQNQSAIKSLFYLESMLVSKFKFWVIFRLISPELGLHLVEKLCGRGNADDDTIDHLLNNNIFEMVINANPKSRMEVESGDFCLRVNENGVDLNRNWDDHWENTASEHNPDVYAGKMAFSEPET